MNKVLVSEQVNYQSCPISEDYLCEHSKLKISNCEFCQMTMPKIDQKLKNQFNKKFAQNQSFVTSVPIDGIHYVLTFYPLKNLQQQAVAYIIGYSQNDYFVKIKYSLYIEILLFSFLNILIISFIFHIEHNKELIQGKNKTLVKLNQDKNEFLGIAAHDLKNPLSAIKGFSEEIETHFDELSKEEILEITGLINKGARQMFALISNLLDVSAIESGQFNLSFEEADLLPIVQRVIQAYEIPTTAKGIEIHLNVGTSKRYLAHTDKNIAYQILDNLISNAVKYSPWHQSIYINLQIKQGFIHCAIKDEGPGLSQIDQEKLFGKFTRLTSKPTNGEHSTGLGLFIVKKLVEAVNAKVWCESELGQGATFIVHFPV